METRSGRRLTSPPPPRRARRRRGPRDRDADLIGALPDDILILVLVRLRCVPAAARIGLLSRRWRGLWTRLPDLYFYHVVPAKVGSALSRFAASPAVSVLDIRIWLGHTAAQANSLLRAAAMLSPAELSFCFPECREDRVIPVELPCFQRTTSIVLVILHRVKPPTAGEFTALERLALTGTMDDLGALLARCPSLRVLSATLSGTIRLSPPSNSEFPALERVSLRGSVVDLGIFLSRCPRLLVISVAFVSGAPGSLQAALATLEAMEAHHNGATVSLLAIHIPIAQSDAATLLRAAARLSPQKLVLARLLDDSQGPQYTNVDLPCFHHATSIKFAMPNICFARLLDGEFSGLDRLSLK
ncbi:hypothetical protein ACQ4PT_013247 [Festuca glaucescens]